MIYMFDSTTATMLIHAHQLLIRTFCNFKETFISRIMSILGRQASMSQESSNVVHFIEVKSGFKEG